MVSCVRSPRSRVADIPPLCTTHTLSHILIISGSSEDIIIIDFPSAASWLIKSNTESGTGYSDILVEVPNNRTGIVIELKYAENGDMDAACDEALKQIEEKSYVDKLKQDGMRNFIKYGIACFKKDCKVVVSE